MNKQNDRIYLPKRSAENVQLRLATRTEAPPMVMVWTTVTADGCSPLIYIDRGVKTNAEYYRENVLKPWAGKHFGVNQEWLKKKVSSFISTVKWQSKSPDLKPLDFCAWVILKSKVVTKKYQSVDHLKLALRQEWPKIQQRHVRAAYDGFVGHLKAIIRTKGCQFV